MIKSRHTGINVRSLAESLMFYVDTLGMTIKECRVETGDYIDKLTGIEGTLQMWAKVSTEDGHLLELVQWINPTWERKKGYRNGYASDGINHICFEVDDVQAIYDRLTEKNTIQTDPPGKVRNFSAYDPDGNIVEFVEVL